MAGLVPILASSFKLHSKVAEVVIMPLNDFGKEDLSLGGKKVLQYWPESIEDSKAPNWQNRDIPGAPLPLYQWVSGGERMFSFTAVFSRDMNGEIGHDVEESKFDVDVDAAIAWLRLLSFNDYQDVGDVKDAAIAPPVLWLWFNKTKLNYNKKISSSLDHSEDGVYCIMTEVSVTRSNWFQDGTVKLASVSLGFAEVMQVGYDIYPYGRSDFRRMAEGYNRRPNLK
jgi:hypothetical protein